MSETHAHTAAAQADLERADAQGGKPNVPPGHVEARRPAARGMGAVGLGPVVAGAVAIMAIAAGVGLALVFV